MTREPDRRAGWYDDPSTALSDHESDAAQLRYWDGVRWSPHVVPKPGAGVETDARLQARASVDEVPGHTVRLRAPDEHTTVPMPPEHDGRAASISWIARVIGRARLAVGGRRPRPVSERTSPRTRPAG